MRYQPTAEDFEFAPAHGSAEPFQKPDHKAKKHGRPRGPRRNEKVGGGHFVFRRSAEGRIGRGGLPFEHPSFESALTEANRLHSRDGGTFEVYSRLAQVGAVLEAAE